jgi:nitroimidazol reductase NimA-like FMN-containing flavoprotein (pyridoxamine 5'-phosphate oxidase superfamily)
MSMTDRPRHHIRRVPDRGHYDRETIHAILDSGFVCHVGLVQDGQPFAIPMAYARAGERLLLHGSRASRTMRVLGSGAPVCVTVTLIDGLVLARSQFHHSMNYRSVVVLGSGTPIEDGAERARLFERLVEHIIPGRAAHTRPPNAAEDAQTMLVAIPLEEASAKVRAGPPVDEEDDHALEHWAGLIGFSHRAVSRTPDPRLRPGIDIPDHVAHWNR